MGRSGRMRWRAGTASVLAAALSLSGLSTAGAQAQPIPAVAPEVALGAVSEVPGTVPSSSSVGDVAATEAPAVARMAATAAAPDSGFGEKNRFVGRLGYSADGLGQNGAGGALQADVPAGSTIRLAYLYGTYFRAQPSATDLTIRFGGQDVALAQIPSNGTGGLSAARADVTAQLTAAHAAGGTSFAVGNDPASLNGLALLVVYENAALPVTSIAVIDGGASQSGQRTVLDFTAALDPAAEGFTATMSLGIGHGYQGGSGVGTSVCGTTAPQSSIIDVNDVGLTSCAGNYDDGVGSNGGLITVGGIGDDLTNPSDPLQRPADGRSPRVRDDELYDLEPFISKGDRSLEIDTVNPSVDDIIFLTVVSISARIESVTSMPVGQTFGTGGSGHGGNPTGYQADPVNSWTGFFVTAMTDAVLPTRGPALVLDRTYTSGDDASSLLGRGWSSTWSTRLELTDDAVVLVAEDGQRLAWERGLGGQLLAPAGVRSTLSSVDGGYELVRRDGLRYRFDRQGRLQELRDARGLSLVVERGPDGRIDAVVDEAGRRATFTHDGAGQLSAVALPDGRTVRYGYDDGLLVRVEDVRGQTIRYGYDDAGRLATITDQANTTLVTNRYDDGGRVVTQVDATGGTTTFDWDDATLTSTMTDAEGGRWKDVYDEDGRLVRRVDPMGGTTAYGWDDDLDLTSIEDPDAEVTTYRYDDRGNVLEIVGPDRARTAVSFDYDSAGQLTSTTDGKGRTTSFGYDPARSLNAVTGPTQDTAAMTHDDGLPVAIADRRGGTTLLSYDDRGNVVRSTAPGGGVTSYRYDASGRVTQVVDPSGVETSMRYDAAGNLLSVTDDLGHRTTHDYDATGRRTRTTDGRGQVRRFAYDDMGRLQHISAADGGVTTFGYDRAGRVTARTDANRHTTRYHYDAAGRVDELILPTGESWTLRHDPDGNVTHVLTPRGAVDLEYDEADRLVLIDYADTTPDVTMTYDANGNRTSQTDGAGRRTFDYDADNRLTAVRRGAEEFGYDYDASGNVVERRYPDGRTVAYDYSLDGLLTDVVEAGRRTTYTYDPAGRMRTATLPNGTTEDRTYDAAGRLTGVVHKTRQGRVFDGSTTTLDANGNPVTVRSASDGRVTGYAYDTENRLVRECAAAACPGGTSGADTVTYTYDAVGNRTTETRPGATTASAYDAADRLTSRTGSAGTVRYTYDRNGNRTGDGTSSYTFDMANRLVAAVDAKGATRAYTYDGDGLLTSSGDEQYLWDLAAPAPLLAAIRTAGEVVPLTHGHDLLRLGDSTVHQDALGAVTSLTDDQGLARAAFEYDAFGTLRRSSGRDAGTGPTIGYAGLPRQADTGLVHALARTYDPATGTFLQRDPVAAVGALPAQSAYAWSGNRPTVLSDPTGQCPFCVLAGVGAVVGGIVGGAGYAITTNVRGEDFSWRELGGSVAGGAVAGAVAGVAGPLGGTVALGLGAGATGGVATAATLGITAAGGALGATANAGIGQGRWPTGTELVIGATVAAATGWGGAALAPSTRGMSTVAQTQYFGPRTWAGLISGKRNISAIYQGALVGGGLELGLNVFTPAPPSGK